MAFPSLTWEWHVVPMPSFVNMLGFIVGRSVLPFQVQQFVPSLLPFMIMGSILVGIGPGMFNRMCVASSGVHSS